MPALSASSRLALAALAAAATLAGCGGGQESGPDLSGEQEAAARPIEDLQKKIRKPDEICRDVLTRELARSMAGPGTSCPLEMRLAIADADAFQLQVTSVVVSGDRAAVGVRNIASEADSGNGTFLVRKQDGLWRIHALAAASEAPSN